ncbi:MAG: PLP-dependent aminotransferase family protein [Rhodospirillaceae bacterium]|jgi:GntR family transcriptional regulator / MocR family aminotransferase|nr:PLP-dependent aminotransferase family protein [Rhodospirillaceae bacterium]
MRDSLFHLSRVENASLQTQIREMLVSSILEGGIPHGEALPSSRRMAQILGVSRNTVVLTYQALVDDGYLQARERSGFYVNPEIRENLPVRDPEPIKAPINAPDWSRRFRVRPSAQANIEKPTDWRAYEYPFIYGQVDEELFPIGAWRECSRQALGRRAMDAWTGDSRENDDPMLVEQIRTRLLPRRGIYADSDQILITLGAQNALYLLASLLISPETTVAMEEPGYADARNIFSLKTRRISLIPVDERGLPVDDRLNGADYVFVTPSHQFPTTVTMPIERRQALLQHAAEHDSIIIEDDYEAETNYVSDPTPALKTLDTEDRVIYIGSLSKTLFPGLRLGYLVGSKDLISEARHLRRLMLRHAPNNTQRTAALFMSLGYHDTLIHRLHRAYRERWQAIGEALQTHMPNSTREPTFGGTSYWVRGPDSLDSGVLEAAAREQGVLIEPGTVHFGGSPRPRQFFRLGFSSIAKDRIEPGIKTLAKVVEKLT